MRAIAFSLLRPLLRLLLVLAGVLTLIFSIPYFVPGGPERALIGWPFTADRASALRAHYGFDRPFVEQYALWFRNLAAGEWGRSKFTGRPILRELALTLPLTLKLLLESIGIAALLSSLLALSALRPRNRVYEERGQGIFVVSAGFPDFYFGILLKFFFVWHLEWFPLGGFAFFAEHPWQAYKQLLLPALSVGMLYGIVIGPRVASRLTTEVRSLEEGVGDATPILTGPLWRRFGSALGYSLLVLLEYGGALAGSVMLAEKIFGVPGFGDFGIEAFVRRDHPKVQAFLIITVGTYAAVRVLASAIEASLEHRLLRNPSRLLCKSRQKRDRGIGGLLMQDGFFLGVVLVVAFVATTVFAGHVAPFLPDEVHMKDRLQAPTTQYWMGADLLGRDILSRLIYGGRYSLMIGAAGATGALLVGFVVGGIPRLARGVGMALATPLVWTLQAFPALILGMLMMAVIGQGYLQEGLALTVALAPQAAAVFLHAHGQSQSRLPVFLDVMSATWLKALAMAITLEATLNFLDIGLLPLMPSWGGDLKTNLPYLHINPAIVLFPGMAVVAAALGFNLMAEAVQKHTLRRQLL